MTRIILQYAHIGTGLLEGRLSSGVGPAPQESLPATLASSEHHSRGRQRKVQTRAQESLRSRATKLTRRKAGGPTFNSFCLHFPDSMRFITLLLRNISPQPILFIVVPVLVAARSSLWRYPRPHALMSHAQLHSSALRPTLTSSSDPNKQSPALTLI